MSEKPEADGPPSPEPAVRATPKVDAYNSTLPGFLGIIDNVVARIEGVMLAVGVLLLAANTVANVVGRFIFQYSLFFSEELNGILIILITFAGISYAARQGRHIRMSAIYDALPPKGRKLLMIVITFVTAFFMFVLCYYAFTFILTQAGRGRVLSSLPVPVWVTLVWVPIGFLMTGLQYFLTGIKNILSKDTYLSTAVLEGYDDNEMEV